MGNFVFSSYFSSKGSILIKQQLNVKLFSKGGHKQLKSGKRVFVCVLRHYVGDGEDLVCSCELVMLMVGGGEMLTS